MQKAQEQAAADQKAAEDAKAQADAMAQAHEQGKSITRLEPIIFNAFANPGRK